MKFMKLGSKPDLFQSGGDNTRYVASELAADLVIKVGNVRFYLHKFPLLSKSSHLQKLVTGSNEDARDEINIPDIPGGHAAFEICAKFCYGMTVTLNAYNVVATRCAAEYLEMNEAVDKGNLVYKVHVFLTSSVFRSWKDSIIVLQTTRSFLPWSEELKIVTHCLDSIALKATVDPSKVEWSYTYNRKDGLQNLHPDDWWVEDLCDLHIDLFKKVITSINSKGVVSADVIAEALKAYAHRRLPGFSKGTIQGADPVKYGLVINTIISLLPTEKNSAPCSFLLRLLQASMAMDCAEETQKKELIRRIGSQLDEATVTDLAQTDYNTDIVRDIVEQFVGVFASDASKAKVAALIDGYLTEVAKDPNLDLSKFVDLADMVSGFPRPSHDQIYRAIDMYLKEHPGISKSERKRICRLMDCRKLSVEACMHAVQNERLPLRVVVQVLFFEQVRAATSSDEGSTSHLPGGPHGSSRTTTDEDWDAVPTAEEFSALKLREDGVGSNDSEVKRSAPKEVGGNKVKMSKKILAKMWSNKERQCENSSSDTSGSPASRSRRHSLS